MADDGGSWTGGPLVGRGGQGSPRGGSRVLMVNVLDEGDRRRAVEAMRWRGDGEVEAVTV